MSNPAEELRKIMIALEETVANIESGSEKQPLMEYMKYDDAIKITTTVIKTCKMLMQEADVNKLHAGIKQINDLIFQLDTWLEQSPDTAVLRQPK